MDQSDREIEGASIIDFASYRNDRINRGLDQGVNDFISTFGERLSEEDKKDVQIAVDASLKSIEPAARIMEMAMAQDKNDVKFMMLAQFSKAVIGKVAEEYGYDEKQIDLTAGIYFDSLGQIMNIQLNS